MPYIVCAEEVEDRWVAHVPDLPGCFASDKEREVAISAVPGAIQHYVAWCAGHGLHVSGISGPMVVDEVIRSWMYEDDYEVNAFFAADRLTAVRDHLLASLPSLPKRPGVVTLGGETWSARKVIRRAFWHERDHTQHVLKLRSRLA